MIRELKIYSRRVTIINGESHYFVKFRDAHGKLVEIDLNEVCMDNETTKKVFYEAEEQHREDMRQYRSDFTHTERKVLKIDEIDRRSIEKPQTPDELVLMRELGDAIAEAICSLPDIQRRRFFKYHISGMTLEEIASVEGCSPKSVYISIQRAQENLKNLLKNFSE